MNLLTVFILTCLLAIVFRNYIQRALFAVLWVYANHWNKWVKEVEHEHSQMLKRNVLTRRQ